MEPRLRSGSLVVTSSESSRFPEASAKLAPSAVPEEPQPAQQAEESVPSSQTVVVHLPLLKRGSTGPAVESAQAVLIHRGYNCGGRKFLGRETPDGDFGPATEKAVRSFQTKAALEPDGEIGEETWVALITE